jgi:hypothetical protein
MAEGVLLYFFLIEIYEDFRSQKKGKGHKSLDLDTIFDAVSAIEYRNAARLTFDSSMRLIPGERFQERR